jgi:hypothetical protein
MFESLGRGLRMIWASVRMGWQDKRLLMPSLLMVFTNFLFGTLLLSQCALVIPHDDQGVPHLQAPEHQMSPNRGRHLLVHQKGSFNPMDISKLAQMNGLNSTFDQGGWATQVISGNHDNFFIGAAVAGLWWLTTMFFEGVTIALVYSHLTEGAGSGKMSIACDAVLTSMPAIIQLGLVTVIAKRVVGFLRGKRGGGPFGLSFGFLVGIIQVFWTIASHLILPAIVIERSSFWGALKRADKIASGNLLTIGFGEVGVDAISAVCTWGVGLLGVAGLWYGSYVGIAHDTFFLVGAFLWACLAVIVIASFLYIRAAFYTCLYVWAIEAESATVHTREHVRPPAPLAHALA